MVLCLDIDQHGQESRITSHQQNMTEVPKNTASSHGDNIPLLSLVQRRESRCDGSTTEERSAEPCAGKESAEKSQPEAD